MHRPRAFLATASALLLLATTLFAQEYPNKPIIRKTGVYAD